MKMERHVNNILSAYGDQAKRAAAFEWHSGYELRFDFGLATAFPKRRHSRRSPRRKRPRKRFVVPMRSQSRKRGVLKDVRPTAGLIF
jgi:hypothetical protein